MRTLLIIAMSLCCCIGQAQQTGRHFLSPKIKGGIGLNVDANGLHAGRYSERQVPGKPAFSVGFIAKANFGEITDIINLSVGFGYRGLFDQAPPHEFVYHPSYSDYLLYKKDGERHGGSEVRPLGGLLVIPAEFHLNLFSFDDGDANFFIGMGMEYGIRFYQPKRYRNYFGAEIMNRNSLSYSPMIGLTLGMDDVALEISLYYRRYAQNCFNDKDIPIDKFSPNYLGFQINVLF